METMADHMIATYREKAEKWTQQVALARLDLHERCGQIFRVECFPRRRYLRPNAEVLVLLVFATSTYRCAI